MKQTRLSRIILGPVQTEKASLSAEKGGRVVFWVKSDSKKHDIKQALEHFLGVKVVSVNTTMDRPEGTSFKHLPSRLGRRKKAYVRFAPGTEVDLTFGSAA